MAYPNAPDFRSPLPGSAWWIARRSDGPHVVVTQWDVIVRAFQQKARELGLVVVINLYERDGDRTFDSSPVIDADGSLLGVTRMVHITEYACFHEQAYYDPGDRGAPVYDTAVGRVGVAICYDRHYPEYMRALGVAGAVGLQASQEGVAEEREVPDRVQDLVPDELVLEAQLVVEDARLADHHRVLEAAAEREAALAQHLDLAEEAERAGGGDRLGEAARRHAQREGLVAQQRVIEADRVADLEVVGGSQARALRAVHHLDLLADLDVQARHGEGPQPRLMQQHHEGSGAAVEDRNLGAVHLDPHVVDAQPRERREQVLDGADRDAGAAQGGRVVLAPDVRQRGRDLDADVGAREADTVLGRGGEKAQAHGPSRMEPDAGTGDLAPQCSTIDHADRHSRGGVDA